jgi:uncharacterized protein with PQ loop repeat
MEALGWCSSLVLVATLAYQVGSQWRERENGGVSALLYVGQALASLGFLVYSLSVDNRVFAFTNSLLLMAAFAGIVIHARNARRGSPPSR